MGVRTAVSPIEELKRCYITSIQYSQVGQNSG